MHQNSKACVLAVHRSPLFAIRRLLLPPVVYMAGKDGKIREGDSLRVEEDEVEAEEGGGGGPARQRKLAVTVRRGGGSRRWRSTA